MNQKLVSIITPCFNGESYVARFFETILAQTYPHLELIFVNDGSTDLTEEIALSFKDSLRQKNISFTYLFQVNQGQAAAINQALSLFRGEYLVWTDADDILHPDNILEKVKFIEENPKFQMIQCMGSEVLEEDLKTKVRDFRRIPPIGKDLFFEDLIMKKNVEYTPGIYMVTRAAFERAIPKKQIDCSRMGQNYQLLLPISYYYPCGYLNKDLFTYVIRKSSHSHSFNQKEMDLSRIEEFKRLLLQTIETIPMQAEEQLFYQRKIKEKSLRDRFQAGIWYKDQSLYLAAYQELKREKMAKPRDLFVKISVDKPYLFQLFQSLRRLRTTLKMLLFSLSQQHTKKNQL